MLLPIKFIKVLANAKAPTKATEGSTGFDLYAGELVYLYPGNTAAVRTGLILDLSETIDSIDVQVRPRSGLALNHGITVTNAPGTIDRDYQGELKVILTNLGTHPHTIQPGDRVAQLVFSIAHKYAEFTEVDTFIKNEGRGAGGFGHTGL